MIIESLNVKVSLFYVYLFRKIISSKNNVNNIWNISSMHIILNLHTFKFLVKELKLNLKDVYNTCKKYMCIIVISIKLIFF